MVLGLVGITGWEMDSVCAAGPERQRYYVGGELPMSGGCRSGVAEDGAESVAEELGAFECWIKI